MSCDNAPGSSLRRHQRIRDGEDFTRALRHGRRISDALFTLYVQPTDHDVARLGLTVSKRVARQAVRRNTIKRLVRESFRRCAVLKAGMDIVVKARHGAATASRRQLAASLSVAFTTASCSDSVTRR